MSLPWPTWTEAEWRQKLDMPPRSLAFNPDQPRDEQGQWTDTGGAGAKTFYHGTAEARLKRILKEGLTRSHVGQVWEGTKKGHVFITTSFEEAKYWAQTAADRLTGGGVIAAPAVLRIEVPEAVATTFTTDYFANQKAEAFEFAGDIKPEWIKEAWSRQGPLKWEHPEPWLKVAAQNRTFYVGIVLLDEPKALGGVGSGNFGHSGRPGEVGGSGSSGSQWVVQWADTLPGEESVRRDMPSAQIIHALKLFRPRAPVTLYRAESGFTNPLVSMTYSRDVAEGFGENVVAVTVNPEDILVDFTQVPSAWLRESEMAQAAAHDLHEVVVFRRALKTLGGEGSGNFGHKGCPGEVGGSGPGLSAEEKELLVSYVGGGHEALNLEIRTDTVEGPYSSYQRTQRDAIDAMIARQPPLPEKMTVYRGMWVANQMKDTGVPPVLMTPGSRFTDKAFVSTTKEPDVTVHFGDTFLEIEVPKGAHVLDVDKVMPEYRKKESDLSGEWYRNEQEVLLPRNSTFEVVKWDQKTKTLHVRLLSASTRTLGQVTLVALGGQGSGNFGHRGRPGEVGGSGEGEAQARSVKAQRALKAFKPIHAQAQRYAEQNELVVREMVGGTRTDDNEPMDVVANIDGQTVGLEVKTMINNTHDKITVRRAAVQKKERWARQHRAAIHTVVIDDRGKLGHPAYSGHRLYYIKGTGSFRLASMTPVKDAKHLKELIAS